jgi:hypothetical protein
MAEVFSCYQQGYPSEGTVNLLWLLEQPEQSSCERPCSDLFSFLICMGQQHLFASLLVDLSS